MKKKIQLVLITLFGVALIAVLVLQEAFLSIYDVDNLERLSEEVNYVLPTQGVPEVAIAIMRSRELIKVSCLALLFIVVILALFISLKK